MCKVIINALSNSLPVTGIINGAAAAIKNLIKLPHFLL